MGLTYSYNQSSIMPLTQSIHIKNKRKSIYKNDITNYLVRYYVMNELSNKNLLNKHNMTGYKVNNWKSQSIDKVFNKF